MKRRLLYLIFTIIGSGSIFAESLTINLETAIDLAMRNNPDFRISKINLDDAARENRYRWSSLIPDFSLGGNLKGTSTPATQSSAQTTWTAGTSLDLSLALNAGLSSGMEQLRLAYEAQLISHTDAERLLRAQVEKEFLRLLAAEANLDIVKANWELAEKRYTQTLTNFNNGLASELETLQAQVSAAALQPEYLSSLASYHSSLRDFLVVLGISPETEVELKGSLENSGEEIPDAQNLVETYLAGRSDIRAQVIQIQILEAQKNQTVAINRTPTLGLSAGWNVGVPGNSTGASLGDGSWSDALSMTLSLSLPLDSYIPGSSTSLSIQSLDSQIEEARITLSRITNEARTEILNLLSDIEANKENVRIQELNLSLARTSYLKSEELYSNGQMQRLEVEDAQQAYLEANQNLLDSRYAYLAGLIDLRYALGVDKQEMS